MKEEEVNLLLERLRSQHDLCGRLLEHQQGTWEKKKPYRRCWRRMLGRYYVWVAGLAVAAVLLVDACTPLPDATAVRINHGSTCSQAIVDTQKLLTAK